MAEKQTYSNHARFFPLFHFVLTPLLLFNLIWQSVRLYQEPSWDRAELILLAFALIVLALTARMQALKAQDRVIRLEEWLRYEKVLPKDLAAKAAVLPTSQIIAMRFASDAELPTLAARVVAGELAVSKEIKQAVTDWKGDYHRV